MLVKNDLFGSFDRVIRALNQRNFLGIDTETYGLRYDQKLFAIQIHDGHETYYFNFLEGEDSLPRSCLPLLQQLFDNPTKTWFTHNAKFDCQKLLLEGLEIKGTVHCTKSIERLIYNDYIQLKGWDKPYSLDSCTRRRKKGLRKDDAVKKYIMENDLWEWQSIPGKKKRVKNLFFNKVPLEIMHNYGCLDAELTYFIGQDQIQRIPKEDERFPVFENERKLTKVLLPMAHVGIKIDRTYTQKALEYTSSELARCKAELEEMVGFPMGTTHFMKKAFEKFGYTYAINEETDNPVFDKAAMKSYNNPLAAKVLEMRHFEKYASAFYSSFLYFADYNDVIHASANQGGTLTGRMSYSDPNLQQVPKEDEDYENLPYLVRKCFVPREGYCFVMIDYSAQEFRLMLDYAGETRMIEAVNAGEDVHQATANYMGTTRKRAKTLNFALLYGVGNEELGNMLGVSTDQAVKIKDEYFAKFPKVRTLIDQIKGVAKGRGHIRNWFGRRLHVDSNRVYAAPNHLIQGGCADIVKVAMIRIHDYLQGKKSRMLIQVHDEIVFEIHQSELDIQQDLFNIMQTVYTPKNGLYLTCSVEHSWISWGACDKRKGFANERKAIQEET